MPPRARISIDPNFQGRIDDLKYATTKNSTAVKNGTPTVWMVPEPVSQREDNSEPLWDGNVFNIEEIGIAFSRSTLDKEFEAVVNDLDSPGVSGDLVAATTQTDYLATMERAFRARHTMRRPRAMAHAAGRMFGHGHVKGVLQTTGVEFVTAVIKRASEKQSEA